MGLGVFIEPDGELRDFILSCKEKMEELDPHAIYLTHPPHLTLIHTDVPYTATLKSKLVDQIKKGGPVEIQIKQYHVFEKDPLAENRNTLTLRVEQNEFLFQLQMIVASTVEQNLSTAFVEKEFPTAQMNNSYKLYGFPFVGDHWIPHFTIGSTRQSVIDEVKSENQKHPMKFNQTINEISVWNINKDSHTKIEAIKFR